MALIPYNNSYTGPEILVNYNGSPASTLMLLYALKMSPENSCIVHFVKIKNTRGDNNLRAEIVHRTLERLKQEGYLFKTIESSIDTTGIPLAYDTLYVTMMSVALTELNRDIEEVYMGYFKPKGIKVPASFDAGTEHFSEDIDLVYPVVDMEMKDIVQELQYEGYYDSVHWCSDPTKEQNTIKACGVCSKCKEHVEILTGILQQENTQDYFLK